MTAPNPTAVRWRWSLALLLLALLVLLLFYQLRPILSPFVIGALIAYLGDPLADRLETRGLGRGIAAGLVFLLIFAVVAIVLLFTVPVVAQQLDTLVRKLPPIFEWFTQTALPRAQEMLGLPQQGIPALDLRQRFAENWQSVGRILSAVGTYVSSSGVNFLVFLGNLVLIPIVAFYLLRDWDKLTPKALQLLPLGWQQTARKLARECDEVIGAFLRGQFLVMLSLVGIYATGLWLVGLELAFLIAVLAGLASVVPFLGTAIGVVAALIAGWVQFQEFSVLLWVGLVFAVGQALEAYLLTPRLVGDRIGLHPVAVIFAVLAGGQLAGFVGILLALPGAAMIMVLLRHLHQNYRDSEWYGDERDS